MKKLSPLILCALVTGVLWQLNALAAETEDNKNYSPYPDREYPTQVFFGDTHHHTANSGDAFMATNRLSPEQAYRFA